VDEILIDPDAAPPPCQPAVRTQIDECAVRIRSARQSGATVMLIYGAHLLRNGAALILERLMVDGWLTHLATNGAGTIHDWEYAWSGASTESVEMNVEKGQFGTWDETATYIHAALAAGALNRHGYGRSLGRFIAEDGAEMPSLDALTKELAADPANELSGARADAISFLRMTGGRGGKIAIRHAWKHASILAHAWRLGVPLTVHPGIGYDIISNHPLFSGAIIGRAGELDFKLFGGSVARLDGGVVLSVGSAIMGPQVFEKSLSCVNNLRLQEGRDIVRGHSIHVVDLQDGGGWDWRRGEPPKTHPAYYLRFCKSYSRMGAPMHYVQCDNVTFMHHLLTSLCRG
jgi:hypothetical protein